MKRKNGEIGSGVMASYGVGKFLAEFLTGAFGAIVFKFYETEIGLAAGYAAIATIIYSLWNAVNDPIIGFITNRRAPLSHKLGRRFPWIIIGLLLSAVSFVLIFAVPASWQAQVKSNPIPVFIWMVISICLYDAAYSLWEVNYQSVYPDKFRSQAVRTKAMRYQYRCRGLGCGRWVCGPSPSSSPMVMSVATWSVAGSLSKNCCCRNPLNNPRNL